jgi:hypothetical protein
MRRHATHERDSSLRRLSRVNRWLLAGSLTLTGVLTEVVAHAFPGTAHASSASTAAKAARHKHSGHATTHHSTSTRTLKPPAHVPEASESSSEGSSEAPTEPAPEATHESAPAEEPAPEREAEPAPKPEAAPEPAPEAEAPVVSGGS